MIFFNKCFTAILLFILFTNPCFSQYSFERRYQDGYGFGCKVLSSGYAIASTNPSCWHCPKYFEYLFLDTFGSVINSNRYYLNQEARAQIFHKSIGDTLLILGEILNTNFPAYDLFIKKIDKSGGLIWEKQIVSDILADHITAQSICNTIDSSYLILYLVNDSGIRYMKLNSYGDSLYAKKIGLPFRTGLSMTELHDNGFAILGNKDNEGVCIIRLDANGDTLWSRSNLPVNAYFIRKFI
jgi:hypothetical protein